MALLKHGDIISTDIYFNKTLLIKAGTVIDDDVITRLKNWGISKVNVVELGQEFSPQMHAVSTPTVKKKQTIFYSKSLFNIKELFYESLQYVVSESRYGYVLHNDLQMQWLENLFLDALKDSKIASALFTLKNKDPYTYFHSFDVFLLGSLLANISGIRDIKSFAISALIHDIGKLKLPTNLLSKEGKLTTKEYQEIQRHTIYGVEWAKENKLPIHYYPLIKYHHERLDGTGYPDNLKAHQIPSDVRILSIVDTYSAMTLKKPYREPMSSTKAIEFLLGKQQKFDLKFLINFIELLNIYPKDSIVRLSNGKTARIKSINENQPYRPLLEELDGSATFELPMNLSVTIPRFIRWDNISEFSNPERDKKEISWNSFINSVINGNQIKSVETFTQLTKGMAKNDIFIDVIVKSIKDILNKRDEGQLSVGEEHDALIIIKEILDVAYHQPEA